MFGERGRAVRELILRLIRTAVEALIEVLVLLSLMAGICVIVALMGALVLIFISRLNGLGISVPAP